jgi:hypothetical protein
MNKASKVVFSKSPPPTHTHLATKPRTAAVLFCLLAKGASTKQGKRRALAVKGQIRYLRYQLRPLPAAPLGAHHR